MESLEDNIEQIEKFGHLFEIAEIKIYRGFRKKDQTEVTVTVHDHGKKAGPNRYFVTATRKVHKGTDKYAAGNGGSTLENALGILHWTDLDN